MEIVKSLDIDFDKIKNVAPGAPTDPNNPGSAPASPQEAAMLASANGMSADGQTPQMQGMGAESGLAVQRGNMGITSPQG